MAQLTAANVVLQAALDAEAAMEAEPAADADADDVANNQADREAEVRIATHNVSGYLAWDRLHRFMMHRVPDSAPDAWPATCCDMKTQ